MINSVYGKAMENLRKIINVRLVNNAKHYTKYTSNPHFVSKKIFSWIFVAIHEIKPVLRLDKPVYIGFSILDLRELLLYEFHYGYVKKCNTNLLFTGTDNLAYEIKTDYVYNNFDEDQYLLDFSDYQEIQSFLIVLIKLIGEMKDEFKGKIIREFVGLKSKMYSSFSVDSEKSKKAKWVNK